MNDTPGCMSRAQTKALKEALKRACSEPSLLSDLEGAGPLADFEAAFASFCGTRYALAVSSGTAALHTALLTACVGPGDEVIVTPYSWSQSVAPVIFTGATPVFADIDPETLNVDPQSVAERTGKRTKAIVPVHLFGHPADMKRLQEIASDAGAVLLSDGAHALGASLFNRPIAAWGDMTCFSIGRGKLVCGGEGGVLATNDEGLFEKALVLTQHASRARRVLGDFRCTDSLGLNYRLHPVAALLALSDIKTADVRLRHRQAVFEAFRKKLGTSRFLEWPRELEGEFHAPYGMPLIYKGRGGIDALVASVQDAGIPFRRGPVGVPLQYRLSCGSGPRPPFHPTHRKGGCPRAEAHCLARELWALSALDMDVIEPEEAGRMASSLRRIVDMISL